MLNNNISNVSAPIIAFNVDNILFKPKENSVVESIIGYFTFNKAKHDYISREVNQTHIDIINRAWSRNNVSIYLITFTDYKEEIENILYDNDVNYTKLKKIQGIDNLRRNCSYSYYYYFDTDKDLISQISLNNAKDFYSIFSLLKV